nr:MAG TPA: hypothetical protein [Caudoviricetes sp.]
MRYKDSSRLSVYCVIDKTNDFTLTNNQHYILPLKLCFSIVFTVASHHTIPSQRIRSP